MAKDAINEYSSTAASNTDVGGVSLAEGVMTVSDINDSMREMMSHLADFSAGTEGIDVLNLQDDDGSASIKIQAPSAVTTTTTFTLPDGDGANNAVLTTNGSGTLSWSSVLSSIPDNSIGADEINISGNGTAGQAVVSDGDGSFSYGIATPTPVGFRARLTSGDLSGTNVIVFNTEVFDQGSNFNTSNGRFVAPEDGLFFISYVGRASGQAPCKVDIRVNGTTQFTVVSTSTNGSHGNHGMSGGILLSLSSSDYVDAQVTLGTIGGTNTNEAATFSGYLVR